MRQEKQGLSCSAGTNKAGCSEQVVIAELRGDNMRLVRRHPSAPVGRYDISHRQRRMIVALEVLCTVQGLYESSWLHMCTLQGLKLRTLVNTACVVEVESRSLKTLPPAPTARAFISILSCLSACSCTVRPVLARCLCVLYYVPCQLHAYFLFHRHLDHHRPNNTPTT